MKFARNKYRRWYCAIIRRAKSRQEDVTGEVHHIVPRSLGGTNHSINLVKLTYREHFIAHRLLVLMTTGQDKAKMYYALSSFLRTKTRRILSSRDVAVAKEAWAKAASQPKSAAMREKLALARTGAKHSEEVKLKISRALQGMKRDPDMIKRKRKKIWTDQDRASYRQYGGRNARQVIYEGRTYPSVRACAAAVGVSVPTVYKRIQQQ